MTQKRKNHPDIIKIFATYIIVMGHSGVAGYLYYMKVSAPLPRFLFMMNAAFMQAATIPLYAMISGAFLLPREESLTSLFRKRVLRFFLLLATFSLISYLYSFFREGGSLSVREFLCNLFSYEQVYSYWYLYAYLAFLVVLPFLRILANRMTDTDYRYFFAIAVVYYLMSPLAYLLLREPLSPSDNFVPFTVQTLIFFPLAGHYIENRLDDTVFTKKNTWIAILIAVAGLAFEAGVQYLYSLRYQGENYGPDLYLTCLTVVPGPAIYFAVKALLLHRSIGDGLRKLILFFSSTSFGVYLLHHIYLKETAPIGRILKDRLGLFPGNLVWVLLICLLGTAVSWLLKKLPGFRKML
ncbi:MAG: acyltransferase [Oscillospiraceae bacterium]|nr:acyltransferase [Oscillospiraceae bacterium]